MPNEKEPTLEESLKIAAFIEQVKILIMIGAPDVEYMKGCVKALREQANRQETLSVLNAHYPPAKNELIREQARALEGLIGFIEGLQRCEVIRGQVANQENIQSKINKMFL